MPEGYNILSIGRLSREKDQMTLLESMKYLKNIENVNLIFAGRGPMYDNLYNKSKELFDKGIISKMPIFGFYTHDELKYIVRHSDLYIHTATVEVEGLSCLEALNEGIVPIIAEGELTATSQFALSEESKFKVKDAKELAKKIDYWLDNDDLRNMEAKKYTSMSNDYCITKSIDSMIEMFKWAVSQKNK